MKLTVENAKLTLYLCHGLHILNLHFLLKHTQPNTDPFFTAFDPSQIDFPLPDQFAMSSEKPHAACLLAVTRLQEHLQEQEDWTHNFGLTEDGKGTVIGKMFGVLVVRTEQGELGYLSAFSGKLAGGNHHALFVPPVFDSLKDGDFLNTGMTELTLMNEEIRILQGVNNPDHQSKLKQLKIARSRHSTALQKRLFDHYHFLNRAGTLKSLYHIFEDAGYKNPPAGAGECAAPKLLQYAFQHNMKPLALAEFWWGQSPKSDYWKHGHFYPACEEKCRPIMAHMLMGINEHN